MGRGTCNGNGSVSAGTEKILQVRNLLVPHRLSTEAIGLSVHPNDTHPYIKQNHEPKNLNPNSYHGGSTLLHGGGKGTPTQPEPTSYVYLCFVLLMHVTFTCKFVPFIFNYLH